jgi:hypothetical protein
MARERKNPPPPSPARERRRGGQDGSTDETPGERIRRRLQAEPELELTEEELRALADEGIDPELVQRLAREEHDLQEASVHDLDTARDQLEGLVLEQEEEEY